LEVLRLVWCFGTASAHVPTIRYADKTDIDLVIIVSECTESVRICNFAYKSEGLRKCGPSLMRWEGRNNEKNGEQIA
jgi:hypothetical protein